MVFTPLLASTACGTIELRSIAEPIRYGRPHLSFQRGKAQTIFPDDKIVRVRAERPLGGDVPGAVFDHGADLPEPPESVELDIDYDALIIAVGARNNTFNIEGVATHAQFLKELSDARAIRRTIIRNFETASFAATTAEQRASLLSFVVVGGGPTGVEFAAELHDFIEEDLAPQYPNLAGYSSIKIIEGRSLLGAFEQGLRDYCKQRFSRQNIGVVQANVAKVEKNVLTLSDGAKVPFGLCVWSTGIAPRRLVSERLGKESFRTDEWGHLVVDGCLRVERPNSPLSEVDTAHVRAPEVVPGVFAIGDCTAVEGERLAATAQVAEQQGAYLAQQMNLNPSWAVGESTAASPSPFRYRHQGSLAYVGGFTGVSDFTQVNSNAFKGKTVRGFASFVVWRSAYLTKLGSWRNRLQVPIDWFRTFFWGRDTSLF
jgi:NADH:ubiquinone reductase (non-electrogenic)